MAVAMVRGVWFSLMLCCVLASLPLHAAKPHTSDSEFIAYTVMPLVFSPAATREKIQAMTVFVEAKTGFANRVFIANNFAALQRHCREHPVSIVMWPESFQARQPCAGFEKVASAINPVFLYQRRDYSGDLDKVGIIANTRAAKVAQAARRRLSIQMV